MDDDKEVKITRPPPLEITADMLRWMQEHPGCTPTVPVTREELERIYGL